MNHKNNEELEAAAEKDPSAQLLWALDRIAAREHNELYVPKVTKLMSGILSSRRRERRNSQKKRGIGGGENEKPN